MGRSCDEMTNANVNDIEYEGRRRRRRRSLGEISHNRAGLISFQLLLKALILSASFTRTWTDFEKYRGRSSLNQIVSFTSTHFEYEHSFRHYVTNDKDIEAHFQIKHTFATYSRTLSNS